MLTSRVVRITASRLGWVGVAIAVALPTTGCASSIAGGGTPATTGTVSNTSTVPTTSTAPAGITVDPETSTAVLTSTTATSSGPTSSVDWNPDHLATVKAAINQGSVAVSVGQRLQIAGNADDSVNYSVTPPELTHLIWYGSDVTFVALAAGTVKLEIPNYNKHFDCPNGPCAHLNAPLTLTVTVAPGTAPKIPAGLRITDNTADQTVHLTVGQQLEVPATMSLTSGDSTDGGQIGELTAPSGAAIIVGAHPGTVTFGLGSRPVSDAYVHLTVVVDG